MRTIIVSFIGPVAPGVPRQMTLALGKEATVLDLLEEITRRGGDALRQSLWTADGRLSSSVLVAIDGEAMHFEHLAAALPASRRETEVSLFLIRPIFGGSTRPPARVERGRCADGEGLGAIGVGSDLFPRRSEA